MRYRLFNAIRKLRIAFQYPEQLGNSLRAPSTVSRKRWGRFRQHKRQPRRKKLNQPRNRHQPQLVSWRKVPTRLSPHLRYTWTEIAVSGTATEVAASRTEIEIAVARWAGENL